MLKETGATQGAPAESVKVPDDRATPRVQQERELLTLHKKRKGEPDVLADGHVTEPIDEVIDPPADEAVPAEPTPTPEPDEGDFETIVVDGVDTQVDKDKIYETGKRALSKDLMADKKLEEAGTKLREANEIVAKARDQAREIVAPEPVQAVEFDEGFDTAVHDLRYGNGDQAKEAVKGLRKYIGAPPGATLTQADVVRLVEKEVSERSSVKEFNSALEWIKDPKGGGFGDLFDGGVLENAFAFEDSQLFKVNPDMSYRDRLQKAGDKIRESFKMNPTPPPPENDVETNAQRKEHVSRSPTSTSQAVVITPEAPKSERQRFQDRLSAEQDIRRPTG